ncbi:MAG TPA: Crp/Fnr family transcriptional regulator [Mycobacteriales bacterium]|nr:Crp/Fnr family transcriptional regulator [Mycobacteriales bacterium]
MDTILRSVPLFAGLGDGDWAALSARLATVRVRRGDAVFHEGDAGDCLFVVLEGKAKISRTAQDGRENLLAVLGPGDLLGELSLFDSLDRTATAAAITDLTLSRLGERDFHSYLDDRPAVARALLRVLARRLRDTNAAMADLVFTDVPGRVAKALLGLADRFGTATADGCLVQHDLTQEELAQLVGASRETVNKALSDFANRGWLRLDGRSVVLLDATRLERRAR